MTHRNPAPLLAAFAKGILGVATPAEVSSLVSISLATVLKTRIT